MKSKKQNTTRKKKKKADKDKEELERRHKEDEEAKRNAETDRINTLANERIETLKNPMLFRVKHQNRTLFIRFKAFQKYIVLKQRIADIYNKHIDDIKLYLDTTELQDDVMPIDDFLEEDVQISVIFKNAIGKWETPDTS